MKKNDWAAIILIIAIVGLASYFIVGAVMPSPSETPQSVPTAMEISGDVAEPSDKIFNSDAINPTVRVTIGDQSNQQPFNVGSD